MGIVCIKIVYLFEALVQILGFSVIRVILIIGFDLSMPNRPVELTI